MLKLYVDCLTYINSAKSSFKRRADEEGFVSAETIAIAVAGVVIVGLLFGIFRDQLTGFADGIMERIGGFEDTEPTP